MSPSAEPDPAGLPTLPAALNDQLFAVLFGDPARRERDFTRLLADYPEATDVLRAHWENHLRLEGRSGPADPDGEFPDETTIAGYRLLSVLGEGGMGIVYRAEQLVPVHRFVAVKVVKPGLDSKAVLARFDQERQSLAAMDHEAIARVFDCGTSSRGQSWFAMELVEGLPMQRYCDERRMSLRERIELFVQICQGVQHAHQKGVIHRDLKPGNLLVADHDGRPMVKIIDFGVARATERSLAVGSLFTEQGMVIGTPEYMSPEQAIGDTRRIDTRADIYSLGVILYELLVGVLPFPVDQLRAVGLLEIQRRLCEEEPQKPSAALTTLGHAAMACAGLRKVGVETLRRELVADLDWVVLTAMAKEPERRYPSATALVDDLRRYLAHEPLHAGPPSATYRLRKLLRRHRGRVVAVSAVFVTAVVGGIVALQFALGERAKVREFDLLKGVVLYEQAIAAEKEMYPAWPHRIEAMEQWLRNCRGLLDLQPAIDATVEDLRRRALPVTAEQLERDRQSHPRLREWQQLGLRIAALRRAKAIRDGQEGLDEPALPQAQRVLNAQALNALAASRVSPRNWPGRVFGEEALGLIYARAALAKADDAELAGECLDTLVWALHANGRDDEATRRADTAVAEAPESQREARRSTRAELGEAIRRAADTLTDAEAAHGELARVIAARWHYEFPQEQAAARFLHASLADLSAKLPALKVSADALVKERLGWAQRIGELTREHPNARIDWNTARDAIATSNRYSSFTIELRDDDVMGLVPLGENPATGLWEFYDLRSAWDGETDPRALPIPQHFGNGSLAVTEESGIVFVLLPGGTVTLGAQPQDVAMPNYDAQAKAIDGLHEVTLLPFLVSRYEVTQGQWARLWKWDERNRRPSQYEPGFHGPHVPIAVTLAHPVEGVTWEMADTLARRNGMALPTDAQWEYACRAGTTTPWWPGPDQQSLEGCANLLDASAVRAVARWGKPEDFDDGFVIHAPVGTFAPNAFGLHDMHGNVAEWTRDAYGQYGSERSGDGLRLQGDGVGHAFRGGSSRSPSETARAAYRYNGTDPMIGVRPVRAITAR